MFGGDGSDDCEWMFGDCNPLARLNPVRWSGSLTIHAGIKDIKEKNPRLDRPIILKVPSGVMSAEQSFEHGQEAIAYLEKICPLQAEASVDNSTPTFNAQGQRQCSKGCGYAAFGRFPTCCTRCTGPSGPHARDCEEKNQKSMPAIAEGQSSEMKLPPPPGSPNPSVEVVPEAAQFPSRAVSSTVFVAPKRFREQERQILKRDTAERDANDERAAAEWAKRANFEEGHLDKATLQKNTERRLLRLIRHGDVNGARKTIARLRQAGFEGSKEKLDGCTKSIQTLDGRGEFCLYGVKLEMEAVRSI